MLEEFEISMSGKKFFVSFVNMTLISCYYKKHIVPTEWNVFGQINGEAGYIVPMEPTMLVVL